MSVRVRRSCAASWKSPRSYSRRVSWWAACQWPASSARPRNPSRPRGVLVAGVGAAAQELNGLVQVAAVGQHSGPATRRRARRRRRPGRGAGPAPRGRTAGGSAPRRQTGPGSAADVTCRTPSRSTPSCHAPSWTGAEAVTRLYQAVIASAERARRAAVRETSSQLGHRDEPAETP